MKVRGMVPHYVAEFISTFFMVFFGCGAIALSQTMPTTTSGFLIPLIFGGIVSIMIYTTGHISGAHMNPAVSIAFWLTRKFPANKLIGYILAQVTGATTASLFLYIIFGVNHSFGVTQVNTNIGVAILVEFILTFSLMFVVMSVATDTRAVGELAGIAIGTTVTICAIVGGPLTGASMNPARSLGPAIVANNFTNLWLYLFVPIVGALLGALTYELIRTQPDEITSPL